MEARGASRQVFGTGLATALGAAGVLLVVLLQPRLALLVGIAGVAAAFAAVLAQRPRVAVAVAVAAVAIVPTYAVPSGVPLLVRFPVGLAAIVLVPAALARADQVRVLALDLAVAAYALVQLVAFGVTYGVVIGPGTTLVARVVLPYAVCRCLGLVPGVRRAATTAWLAAAVALALFALRERAVTGNAFFRLARPGLQATQWARQELRFGDVRAEASFGHPIALGLFLALAVVLLAGIVWTERGRGRGSLVAAAGAAVALAIGLVSTLSRGPLLVAGGGLLLWAAFSIRKVRALPVYLALVFVTLVVVLTPVGATVSRLVAASTGDTAEAASADYRVRVASVLFDPHQFSMLGKESEIGSSAVSESVSARTGVKSYDNEYSRLYVTTGALGLLTFVAVAGLVLRTALRRRLDPLDRAWAVGVAVTLIGLVSVALLTQHADLVWMAIGLVAAIEQDERHVNAHRTGPEAASADRPPATTLAGTAPTT
jgi:hypothetical protein